MNEHNIFEKICLNLKVISKLNANEKIRVTHNGGILIDPSRSFQGFFRYIMGDSRTKTVNKIWEISNYSVEFSQSLLDSVHLKKINKENTSEFQRVIHNLEIISKEMTSSLKGLNNLTTTYREDGYIRSELEIISDKLTNQINIINNMLNTKKNINSNNGFINESNNETNNETNNFLNNDENNKFNTDNSFNFN